MKILLILGNRMNDDGTISTIMEKRLIGALKLLQEMKFDKIICSGGLANKETNITEAHAMEEYLIKHGISKDLIIKEEESLSTVMNMTCSAPIILRLNPEVVYLLTSKDHLNRTISNPIQLFKDFVPGVKVIPYGVE